MFSAVDTPGGNGTTLPARDTPTEGTCTADGTRHSAVRGHAADSTHNYGGNCRGDSPHLPARGSLQHANDTL